MTAQSTRFAGLDFPAGTAIAELEALHAYLSDGRPGAEHQHWRDYAAGVNGWMYCMIQAADADARLRSSLQTEGATPEMPERFRRGSQTPTVTRGPTSH